MISEQARDLHGRALVADAHNDLLSAIYRRPVAQWSDQFRTRWLPQLIEGGVGVQVLPVFVETKHQPEIALRLTMRMIECAHRISAGSPEAVSLCTTPEQIDQAVQSDRIALVIALESAPGVGADVELFETLHRLGVRIASIAHTGRTALADGSGEDFTGSRLTSAGVEAIAEMNRLGMIIDLSHLGVAGVEHALELTSRPVMATHSGARAQFDHHRNLSDDQLRGIAQTDGLVCVNFLAPFLDRTDHTLRRLIDHLEHIAGIVGVERVGLGPDFIQEVLAETLPQCCEDDVAGIAYIPGLEGPRGLPLLTEALISNGWAEGEIVAVLGENLRSFLTREMRTSSTKDID